MKIVQINNQFETGSTGKIVKALFDYGNERGDDTYVIYGMGKRRSDNHLIRTTPGLVRKLQSFRARITGYPYGGCLWGTATALRALRRINPDVVHIQCANGYMVNLYRILDYLKRNNVPTVITNHAEYMYTGGCTHAVNCEKWLTGCYECERIGKEHPISYFFDRTAKEWSMLERAYKGFENLTICCVSDWVSERASLSPFFSNRKIETVLNGIDTTIFHYSESPHVIDSHDFKGKKVVIHVTPNFSSVIKGGEHVIEMANRNPDIEFLIVGSDAIEKSPKNCHFVGRVNDQHLLAQYYAMADVCLITSVRETFSMVCAESLCCGTSVVGFKSGGPELIALKEYSEFVEQGNDDELSEKLREVLNIQKNKRMVSQIAIKKYGQETMCKQYYEIYNMIQKNTVKKGNEK